MHAFALGVEGISVGLSYERDEGLEAVLGCGRGQTARQVKHTNGQRIPEGDHDRGDGFGMG